jgi:hypothetical protein
MRRIFLCSLVAAFFGISCPCGANDIWETQADDDLYTENQLRHGLPQLRHDLEGTAAVPDQDWMLVRTKEGHSYEARVTGVYWDNMCGQPSCPRFDRVDSAGSVLTPGIVSNEDTPDDFLSAPGLTIRWIGQPPKEYLRAIGDELYDLPGDRTYDVEFYDTTLFVPRFNNSATQTTVFVVQNTTNTTVTGFVYFYDAAGTLLSSVALNVLEHGVQVFNTAAVSALAGKSGSATIAQLGGYGALTGKAVAVEPATGFTFDTAITPVPR